MKRSAVHHFMKKTKRSHAFASESSHSFITSESSPICMALNDRFSFL
ncbi:hypothetical protein [Bacillus sp. SG-1]|nr:hypothetical protein [Bacillus sp. SG-1]